MPDLLHVIPARHDPMLDRVAQCQDSALRLRLIADVRVLWIKWAKEAGVRNLNTPCTMLKFLTGPSKKCMGTRMHQPRNF